MTETILPNSVPAPEFPAGLLEWAGHRRGGVRKPFFEASGRPCKVVIETPLLIRLREWVAGLVKNPKSPHTVLLVGGPGNGKTEAVEDIVHELDQLLELGGRLELSFADMFSGRDGISIPRRATIKLDAAGLSELCIVQDASVPDAAEPNKTPPELLVQDLVAAGIKDLKRIYIACVNRGILDDALAVATENNYGDVQPLLETVIRSVGANPSAPGCWPLDGYPTIAVWPMDVETLFPHQGAFATTASPAEQLFLKATDLSKWPVEGTCPAGDRCPFCKSREMLGKQPQRQALLQILRWYELAAGKRWSFRDLFSLVSYLLAGPAQHDRSKCVSPCEWAAALTGAAAGGLAADGERQQFLAPFRLSASLYQHALFPVWPKPNPRRLRAEIRELGMETDPGLMGFYYFVTTNRNDSIPSTLKSQLAGICDALDPALAEPAATIQLTKRELCFGRDVDARFSQSIGEGLESVRRLLSNLECDLLQKLETTDDLLSSSAVRRRQATTAQKLQRLIRDFACRLVRRSLGVRHGVARESALLKEYESVSAGDVQLLHKAVKQTEALINAGSHFMVGLNSTFGEPVLPAARCATAQTPRQRVKSVEPDSKGRPMHSVRFLSVGAKGHRIALTYELFRSVRELESGMLPASLPRAVVALLDTTKARLAGMVVRDEELVEQLEIRIGLQDVVISRELGEFVVTQSGKL